jgi:hypothetical protein
VEAGDRVTFLVRLLFLQNLSFTNQTGRNQPGMATNSPPLAKEDESPERKHNKGVYVRPTQEAGNRQQ